MKKIMKKALSLMLALVMMFSLAPMTAMAAPGESEYEPIVLDNTQEEIQVTIPGDVSEDNSGTMYYYSYQEAGVFGRNNYNVIVGSESFDFAVSVQNQMGMWTYPASPMPNGKVQVTGTSDMMGACLIGIMNYSTDEIDVTISAEVDVPKPGSQDCPDTELELNTPITVECLDNNYGNYYYSWTATATGTLKLTIAEESLEACDWAVGIQYTDKTDGTTDWSSPSAWKSDGNEPTISHPVEEGDVVWFYVSDFNYGEVTFVATITDGSEPEVPPVNPDEPQDPQNPEINYVESESVIGVGKNELAVNVMYPYTVFVFEPTTPGVYTLTSDDSVMGIVGYFWVTDSLVNAEIVCENTIEWECTDAKESAEDDGQKIYLAVQAETNVANITVEWEELVVEEIESENAYPTVSLETYTFDGDLDKLESLMYGLADEKVDFALGEDGFFHVADVKDFDENGDYIGKKPLEELPVVLVKLNDSVVSLQSAIGYGNVKWVSYGEDEDGKPVAEYIIYFNDMLTEYLSYAATDAKLYPLTEDLLYTMILVGADQGWYVEDGAVQYVFANDKVPEELLFTFAMYYLNQDVVTLDKEEPVVDKDAMTDIIANNQAGKDTVINSTTKNEAGEEVTIKFEFAAGTMKPVDGKTEYTFEVSLVEKIDDATAEKAEIKKDTFVLGVSFEYDGKLPAKATITIPVPAAYANKTLYYYEVLADGTLKYVCDAPVDANGNAKVTQDHCSDYVLLSEKIVEELPEAPKTGDTTNFALWIAILGLGVVAIAGSVVMKKREF